MFIKIVSYTLQNSANIYPIWKQQSKFEIVQFWVFLLYVSTQKSVSKHLYTKQR